MILNFATILPKIQNLIKKILWCRWVHVDCYAHVIPKKYKLKVLRLILKTIIFL